MYPRRLTAALTLATSLSAAAAAQPVSPEPAPLTVDDRLACLDTGPRCGNEIGVPGFSVDDEVALLVDAGRDALPRYLDFLREHAQSVLVARAIAWLATEDDSDAIDMLKLHSRGRPSLELAHVGGNAIGWALDRIADTNWTPDSFAALVDWIWMLPREADLERAIAAFERAAKERKERWVRVQVEGAAIPRLRFALAVARHPHDPETVDGLVKIAERDCSSFCSIPGPDSITWALDRLVDLRATAAIPELRRYLESGEVPVEWMRKRVTLVIRALEDDGGAVAYPRGGLLSRDDTPTQFVERHREGMAKLVRLWRARRSREIR